MPDLSLRSRIANRRGMALYLVLGILFLTILLAQIFFDVVLSQASLSHHQVTRNQAYYASRLGMIYAIDRLSNGSDTDWNSASAFSRCISNTSSGTPCGAANTTIESELPPTIKYIKIDVGAVDVSTGLRTIRSTANYTDS